MQDGPVQVPLVVIVGVGGVLQPRRLPETERRNLRPDLLQVEEVQGRAGHPHLGGGRGQAGAERHHGAAHIQEVREPARQV